MSASTSRPTMTAQCAACGADVPLALAGPFPSCRHCGNAQPLRPEVAAKVAAVRGRLEQRAAKQRQMTGRLVAGATSFHGMTIAIMITSWLLFGGMAVGFALGGDPGFASFAFRSVRDVDLAARWWTMFGVAVGLPASIAALGLATFWLRGLARGALPLAPAHPGANPRCRCCGAELPAGAALRRCRFCGADSLVLGDHYQKAEGELDRVLGAMAGRFEQSLAARIQRAESVLWTGSLVPVGILLVMLPVGLVTEVTRPDLWIVPLVVALVAVVSLLLPLARRLPPVDPLECLALESELNVGTEKKVVNAELLVGSQGQAPTLLQVVGADARAEELLLHVASSPAGPATTLWDLRPGGQPLDARATTRLGPAHLTRRGPNATSAAEHSECQAVWDGADLRVWDGAASPVDAAPRWTATRRKKPPIVFVV